MSCFEGVRGLEDAGQIGSVCEFGGVKVTSTSSEVVFSLHMLSVEVVPTTLPQQVHATLSLLQCTPIPPLPATPTLPLPPPQRYQPVLIIQKLQMAPLPKDKEDHQVLNLINQVASHI